jgi:Flp pilus assembly CpaE family ATPase
MISAVVIAPSAELAGYLESLCTSVGQFRVTKTFRVYPVAYEVAQAMNAADTDVLLLELGVSEEALQVAREARVSRPEAVILGFLPSHDPGLARKAEGAGVNELLFAPFSAEAFEAALGRAADSRRFQRLGDVFAFVPAKAGSGSSTTALHVAGALARSRGRKVCLVDADLHSGLLALMLNLNPKKSIVDALENAAQLTDTLWSLYICQGPGIDVLGTPRAKRAQMFSQLDYRHVLGFARERYDFVVVDLPEIINDATEAVVREAMAVFVVCTPEMPSLFLARRRIFELQTRGVKESSLGVVLTRCVSEKVHVADAERVLQRPLSAVLPNDYAGVQEALREGRPIQGSSEIAKAFTAFANMLSRQSTDPEPEEKPGAKKTGSIFSRWFSPR